VGQRSISDSCTISTDAAAAVAARLHDEQARRDELIDRAATSCVRRELIEIGELDDRARALGRDEPPNSFCVSFCMRSFICATTSSACVASAPLMPPIAL
jgi:hypothetical protein